MKLATIVLIILLGIGLIAPILDPVPASPRQDVFWRFSEIGELHLWPYK